MPSSKKPTCKSTRATRSATAGKQKPTTPQQRHELAIAKKCRFLLTLTCRELFDGEHDRRDLACCRCRDTRYLLPGARVAGRWTTKELKGLLVGANAGAGYSREKVLPFMVDKAGTRNTGCERLHRSAEQFRILESLRQRIEKAEWAKIQRGEGN
jgi:hypothetical protein